MWSEISPEEFDAIPGKQVPKPNRWDELLDAIDQGKAIRLPADDQNSLRGMRIGIGRRAKSRQIPIETRSTAEALYIRRAVAATAEDGTGALLEHTIGESEQPGTVNRLTPEELAVSEPEEESATPAHPAPRRGRKTTKQSA